MSLITSCINKLTGGKNKDAIDREQRIALVRAEQENIKTMPPKEAAVAAAKEWHEQTKSDMDYLLDQIQLQLGIKPGEGPKIEGVKKAAVEPGNAEAAPESTGRHKPVGSDVDVYNLYTHPEEKHGWGAAVKDSLAAVKRGELGGVVSPIVRQALGIGGQENRSMLDYIGNKTITQQFSWQQKSDQALGAGLLNPETKKATGVSLFSAAKNNTQYAEEALATGYMKFDKEGMPRVEADPVNNHAEFGKKDKLLQEVLLKHTGGDKAKADSAHAALYYLPREAELVDMGYFPKDAAPQAARDGLKQLMADPEINKAFRDAKDIHDVIQKRMIDFDEASGRISPETAEMYRKRPEYFALYRQADESGEVHSDAQFVNSLLAGKYKHKLTANTRQPGSPLDNLVRNSTWRIKTGLMTRAAEGIADDMVQIGAAEWMPGKPANAPDIVELLRRGETSFLKVKDKNDLMVFAATPIISGRIMGMFRSVSNALRLGVTLMPMFAYRQLWQDAQHAMLTGGYNISMRDAMAIGSKELWGNIKGQTERARILRQFGVTGQRDFVDTHQAWVKDFEGNPQNTFHKALANAHHIANASDIAARAMVFEMAKKSGATDAAAAHAARMIMNFNDRGSSRSLAAMMTMVPFLNPRIQGNYRFIKALRGEIPGVTPEQGKRAVMMKLAQIGVFTAGYALYNSGDPDYEDSISDIDKHGHFLFSPGGVPLRVPVAPELLPLKVFTEAVVRRAVGNERQTQGKDWNTAKRVLVDEMLFGWGQDFTPTLLKPILENVTNYSMLTGRPLVGTHLQAVAANMRFSEGTSEIAKSVSNILMPMGIEWSPIKIDNMLKGIFASTAVEAARLTNDALAFAGGRERAPTKMSQLPLIGGAFYNDQANQLRSDFVEIANQISTAKATYNEIRKTNPQKAQEYLAENRKLIAAEPRINTVRQQMSMLDEQHKQAVASGDAARLKAVEDRRKAVLRNANIPKLMEDIR